MTAWLVASNSLAKYRMAAQEPETIGIVNAMKRIRNHPIPHVMIIALLLAACGGNEAHDPDPWAGAPWGLRDAPLPDRRPEIQRWFKALDDPPFYSLPPFTIGDDREVQTIVHFPDGGQGTMTATPTGTGADALEKVAARDESVLASFEPSARVIFVAAAIDLHSESGNSETISELSFAQPQGTGYSRSTGQARRIYSS